MAARDAYYQVMINGHRAAVGGVGTVPGVAAARRATRSPAAAPPTVRARLRMRRRLRARLPRLPARLPPRRAAALTGGAAQSQMTRSSAPRID